MSRARSAQSSSLNHYVTLFDRNYASRALALYRSLLRHSNPFFLWVIALDDYTEELFVRLGLENVEVVPIREVETDELLRAKDGRTFAEYCWTLTPFVFDVVFVREPTAKSVTYIDADVWLVQSTEPLVAEFHHSNADVLITEHAYYPAFDVTATSGYFCVQFLSVKRDVAKDIIERWKSQCLEWCFSYPEDGKFGDQGYLNEWPALYGTRVFVSEKKQAFQGPWNALRFPYGEALTYHFHSFVYLGDGRYSVGLYPIPKPHQKNLYAPYVQDVMWAEKEILSAGMDLFGRGDWRKQLNALAHRLVRFREIWTTH